MKVAAPFISRFHHCYADGIALIDVLLSMTNKISSSANEDVEKLLFEPIGGAVKAGIELVTDKKLVGDPHAIVNRLSSEFEKLLLATMMEPWGRKRSFQEVAASLSHFLS
jgi:hypothetical protein